jgi:hypothetical protein
VKLFYLIALRLLIEVLMVFIVRALRVYDVCVLNITLFCADYLLYHFISIYTLTIKLDSEPRPQQNIQADV